MNARTGLFLGALACAGCGAARGGAEEASATEALTAEGSASQGTAAEGAGSSSAADGEDGDAPSTRLDVPGGGGSSGGDGGGCGGVNVCDRVEFSYVWVANTDEATVSKIDTNTMAEAGRYRTGPDPEGHPSRTAVSFDGRAVAVANRWTGGVVKIWASDRDCEDRNGNGSIDTSSGASDVRAWGEDECVAWFSDTGFTTQRPVAWAAGSFDEITCTWVDQVVWTAGCDGGGPGSGGGGPTQVLRLNGNDGTEQLRVELPEFTCTGQGPYGAALDPDGDVWISAREPNVLARIDGDNGDAALWNAPDDVVPYGITVDRDGRVWMTNTGAGIDSPGLVRFDPDTETWNNAEGTFQSIGGVVQGPDGRIYAAQHARWDNGMFPTLFERGVVAYDPDTLARVDAHLFPMEGSAQPTIKGLSFDDAGRLWVTSYKVAYRANVSDWTLDSYDGLGSAYTYSDMTGNALYNVNCPPAG